MAWLVLSEDSAQGPVLRADAALMQAHWDHERSIAPLILAAGSLRADDGVTRTGSLLILDVATRAEAEAVIAADPATRAGLRGRIEIRFWHPAILDRRVLG